MRSFFDSTLIEKWGSAFIREDKIDASLAGLIPNAHITKGHYSSPSRAEQRDLVWNHMDQSHRPLIHRTYGDAMRVFIGEQSAFSLTRFGKLPAIIPVFDGYYKDNGFYQIVCVFGLIVVVNVIECNLDEHGTRMDIYWAIASHRLLRFLHGPLDRRLRRLNEVQIEEDREIRDRRVVLRAMGYRFATDSPDFVNSNVIANNVVFPPIVTPLSLSLAEVGEQQPQWIEVGGRAYILRRSGEDIDVWPGVCPHEGAVLAEKNLEGGRVKCHWHGLEYGPRRLVPGGPAITLCGARLELKEGTLRVSPDSRETT